MPKQGLLSITLTPAALSIFRDCLFSAFPLRRLGFNMMRTLTPRFLAAMTAFSSAGSEKTNIFTRRDFFALLMASRIGLAESSGRTIKERDMTSPQGKPSNNALCGQSQAKAREV